LFEGDSMHVHRETPFRVPTTRLCVGLIAAASAVFVADLPNANAETLRKRNTDRPTVYYGNQRYPSENHFYGRASEEEEQLERLEQVMIQFEASETVRHDQREALERPDERTKRRIRGKRSNRWSSGSYHYRTASHRSRAVSYPANSCGPYGCSSTVTYRPTHGLYRLYAPYICGAEGGYGFYGKGFSYGYGFGESSTMYDRHYWCTDPGAARPGNSGSSLTPTRVQPRERSGLTRYDRGGRRVGGGGHTPGGVSSTPERERQPDDTRPPVVGPVRR